MLAYWDRWLRLGACVEDIARLIAASGTRLPQDYLAFLRQSNGGEWPLLVQPLWLILDDAATVADTLCNGTFDRHFPGLIVIGSNGAGEAVAFDFRPGHAGEIVNFDMANIALDESIQALAPSFSALLSLVEARQP
jgi:hypothetical protein